ncbi:hypothetical protein TrST_g9697 [Triparma strigata]|uniref:Uncharacterized protein n=1 Tax=Triparma strigata TaxID=1606541 RepID=A0A9W7DUN8_9STRA|nr:hypothetical protein TrST_g9697 [Triparma strigata]
MELYELIEVYDLYADEGWQGKAGVDLGKINKWREMKEKNNKSKKRKHPSSPSSLLSEVHNFTTSKPTSLKCHLTGHPPPSPTLLSLITSAKNSTLTYSTLLPTLLTFSTLPLQSRHLLLTDVLPHLKLSKKTPLILPTLKTEALHTSNPSPCISALSTLSLNNKKYRKVIDDIISMIYTSDPSDSTLYACVGFYERLVQGGVRVLVNPVLVGLVGFGGVEGVERLCGVLVEGGRRWGGEEIGRMYEVMAREMGGMLWRGRVSYRGSLLSEVGEKVKNEMRLLERGGESVFGKFSIVGEKWEEFVQMFIEELRKGGVVITKEDIVGGRRKKYLEFLAAKGFEGVSGLIEWVGKKDKDKDGASTTKEKDGAAVSTQAT